MTRDDIRLLMCDLAITCRDQINAIDDVYVDKYRKRPATKAECLRALRKSARAVARQARRVLKATAKEPKS